MTGRGRSLLRAAAAWVGLYGAMAGTGCNGDKPVAPRGAAEAWLAVRCTNDREEEIGALLARLRAEPSSVDDLTAAFVAGPQGTALDKLRVDAGMAYDARESFLAGPETGIAVADLTRLRSVSRADYVTLVEERFVRGYKSAAVRGLAAIDNAAAKRALVDLLTKVPAKDSDIRELIEAALARPPGGGVYSPR